MKKILTVMLILIIAVGTLSYSDEVLTYTLDELFNISFEDNTDIKLAELDIEVLEYELIDINEDAEINDYLGGDRVDLVKRRIMVLVDTLEGEYKLELAKMQLEKDLEFENNEIVLLGQEYLLKQNELALNEAILENYKQVLEYTQQRFNNGLITELDLSSAETSVDNQIIKVNGLETDLEKLMIDINFELDQPLDTAVTINDSIDIMPMTEYEIDKYVEYYLEEDLTVYEKTNDLEAKKRTFEIYAESYDEFTGEYKEALYNYEVAQLNLENAKRNYEVNIRSLYNSVLTAYDSYEINQKLVELSEKKYSDAELKFSLGLISEEELLNTNIDLLNAKYDMLKSIYDYNNAVVEFNTY